MATLGQRIRRARSEAGFSQAGLAKALGLTRSATGAWERDKHAPSHEHLVAIAKVTGRGVSWLLQEENGRQVPAALLDEPMERVEVVGTVQAGVWREALEAPADERFAVEVPRDRRFPGVRRFGLRVAGPSMNRIFPERSIVLCARFPDLGRDPEPDDYVVVLRNREGLVEATVKQLERSRDGRLWLSPRSDDPEHQTPWPLPAPTEARRQGLEVYARVMADYEER